MKKNFISKKKVNTLINFLKKKKDVNEVLETSKQEFDTL